MLGFWYSMLERGKLESENAFQFLIRPLMNLIKLLQIIIIYLCLSVVFVIVELCNGCKKLTRYGDSFYPEILNGLNTLISRPPSQVAIP